MTRFVWCVECGHPYQIPEAVPMEIFLLFRYRYYCPKGQGHRWLPIPDGANL